MSGVLNVMMAGWQPGDRYAVTVVNVGSVSGHYGFNDSSSPSGSISPTTFNGATVRACGSRSGSYDLSIAINGTLDQDHFTSIIVQRTDGSWETFNTDDANGFQSGPFTTIWSWSLGVGADPVWTSADTRAIVIT